MWLIYLSLLLNLNSGHALISNWSEHALRLSGESDRARNNAIVSLRRMPNLKRDVSRILLSKRSSLFQKSLALDVITALRLKSLHLLLEKVLDQDQTGQAFLTYALLLESGHKAKVEALFLKKIGNPEIHSAAKMAILSVFSRWNAEIPNQYIEQVFSKEPPEVKLMALGILRKRILYFKDRKYLSLLEKARRSSPYQLRLRAIYILGEAYHYRGRKFKRLVADCLKDTNLTVRSQCKVLSVRKRSLGEQKALASDVKNLGGNILEVGIHFGYKDARPALFVGDPYEFAYLSEVLISPCSESRKYFCGFVRAQRDMEVFQRTFGNDGSQVKMISVHLVSSASSDVDSLNRRDPFQLWKSRYSESSFERSLKRRAVVVYNGHSRDGGGPDFRPPKLRNDNHVHYAFYRRKKPGMKQVTRALSFRRKQPLFLFEIYSCMAKKYFKGTTKKIHSIRPGAVHMESGLVHTADALERMEKSLDQAIGEWLHLH